MASSNLDTIFSDLKVDSEPSPLRLRNKVVPRAKKSANLKPSKLNIAETDSESESIDKIIEHGDDIINDTLQQKDESFSNEQSEESAEDQLNAESIVKNINNTFKIMTIGIHTFLTLVLEQKLNPRWKLKATKKSGTRMSSKKRMIQLLSSPRV